ncbi:SH3 domain-containing protein [Actinomadura montaniterrae]|uniref:SH3 domain-containing protein n=1 Tax=Actinomadura montaniterrae TaxID=1803903 RepID=A0A6L3VLL8_9ACTN|nr:SH3 domain-containing protein [Actinomadura montaniterrae]KAB2370518.1 SH3 domain-containing protein [Actinomadura montaniterrae]
MHVGIKLGVGVAGVALAGTVLGAGGAAGAGEQPPPRPAQQGAQAKPPHDNEEGHGPGAIKVGAKGAAKAMHRLMVRDELRQRWCHGRVLPSGGLNLREGPGLRYRVVRVLKHGSQVTTDWDTVQRRDGYLWVRLPDKFWIADYKTGDGNGKWYIRYSDCH